MRWVYDNLYHQALALSGSTAKEIATIITEAKLIEKWEKRHEKYKGKHEVGDCTDKDIDKMLEAEDKVRILKTFIDLAK